MSVAILPNPFSMVTPPPKAKSVAPPQRSKLTIAEYRELGKSGVYSNRKTMLLDGEIYDMPMPNPPHDHCLGTLDDLLRSILPKGYHVRCQMGLDIGTSNDPGPDLAVVRGDRNDYRTTTPTSAELVVEVADSSLFLDTTTNAELYATAQVPEYWVIDLVNRRVLVFRDPVALPIGLGATAYRTHMTFDPADSFSSLIAPVAPIAVADLLP